ncbi:MAG: hypothetical protein AAE987_02890 [Thermoplasmataceae archaeon]|jgi:hypothetical protein
MIGKTGRTSFMIPKEVYEDVERRTSITRIPPLIYIRALLLTFLNEQEEEK